MARNDRIVRYIIVGDSKSAVRAQREVQQATEQTTSKVQRSSRAIEASGTAVAGTSKHYERFRGTLGNVIGLVGLGGLTLGVKGAVDATVAWSNSQQQLGLALRNTGNQSRASLNQMTTAAVKLGEKGGFGSTEQMQGMAQFVRLTGSATKAVQLNAAATNLARGRHMEYAQAELIMGRALGGSVGLLGRYVGYIAPVRTAQIGLAQAHKINLFALQAQAKTMGKAGPQWLKQQELIHGVSSAALQHAKTVDRQAMAQIALARIQKQYGGATTTYAKSAAGQMSNLSNAVHHLERDMGTGLLPIVLKVVHALGGMIVLLRAHRKTAIALGTAIGFLAAGWATYTVAMALNEARMKTMIVITRSLAAATAAWGFIVAVVTGEFSALEAAMMAMAVLSSIGPIAVFIAIIAVIVLVITHFRQFKAIVGAIWKWLKNAVGDVVGFIKGHWQLLLPILLGPFGAVAAVIIHFRKQIIGFFSSIPGVIKSVFNGVVNFYIDRINNLLWVINKAIDVYNSIPLVPDIGHVGMIGHLGGGKARHMASGGYVGGPGSGRDTVASWLTPGEYVLRPEVVQNVGVGALNALNARGRWGAGYDDRREIVIPVTLKIGQRVLATETARYALKMAARR